MATGANKPIASFHHALPAADLMAAAPLLLWVAQDGDRLTWGVTPEDRSSLVEVGRAPLASSDAANWLREKLDACSQITGVHWMVWQDFGMVPSGIRRASSDRALLETELGRIVAATRAVEVVGTPYTVVHEAHGEAESALIAVWPSIEFHDAAVTLAESFCRAERPRKDAAILAVVRNDSGPGASSSPGRVDFCAVKAGELQAVVRHQVSGAQDAIYRTVHLAESLGWSHQVRIALSGDVTVVGEHIKGFKTAFDKADLFFGRFIPTKGAVSAVHRQLLLPVIQMIECA
ncbi:MAG TPA: hypothetical protein EYQ31_05690 [Candidatus Handelsmanbacteria bacterium]|nr:hypothetical protein [Candidatus Handelsmanbacteria bacterium]